MANSDFEVRTNLPALMADLKQISPVLWRETRAALREAGDAAHAEQLRILLGEPVGGVVSAKQYTWSMPNRRGGYRRGPLAAKLGGARLEGVTQQAGTRTRSQGTRQKVAGSLKVGLTMGKRGGNVKVRATLPGPMDAAFNAKTWRHPVFRRSGQPPFVEQAGNEYFTRGAKAGAEASRRAMFDAIEVALDVVKSHNPT
jgi:hypothetical protein